MSSAFKGRRGHPTNTEIGEVFDDWEELRRSGLHLSCLPIHHYEGDIYSVVVPARSVDNGRAAELRVPDAYLETEPLEFDTELLSEAADALRDHEETDWQIRLVSEHDDDTYKYEGLAVLSETWDELGANGERIPVFKFALQTDLQDESAAQPEPWSSQSGVDEGAQHSAPEESQGEHERIEGVQDWAGVCFLSFLLASPLRLFTSWTPVFVVAGVILALVVFGNHVGPAVNDSEEN